MHPVAIVGGGPVGLVSSILLSQRKIPHILFERYPSTSIHPKACGFNQRTMEIFRQIGLEEEILQHSASEEISGRTAWYTSLGPSGREIVGRDAWGGGQYREEYGSASPSPYAVIPQIRLEPILQRRALQLNPEGLRYKTEVIKVEERQDRVHLTLKHRGEVSEIEASYCIGADGGRGLTDDLGIGWEGERDLLDMISAHVRAPISLYHPDGRNFITWFSNPALGGSIGTGYLYHLGPYPINPETEEWLFACARNPDDPKRFDEAAMLTRLHNTLRIPNLQVELLSLSHWYLNAINATRYRSRPDSGRVFLVGDAAHRIPPFGGLGLNTGIQDVYNLIWKISFAINAPIGIPTAYNALLDTYDEERRPIGQRVAQSSLRNHRSHAAVMDTAIGMYPNNTKQQNIAAVESFFDLHDQDSGVAKRAAVDRAQKALDTEFHALGAEIGWFYPTVDRDNEGLPSHHAGQLDEHGQFDILIYHASTIPGHHLPHVWLERAGVRVSTRDLLRYDCFVLLTRTPGLWEPTVGGVGELVCVESIVGPGWTGGGGAWVDVDGTWAELCGVSGSGAVLVRPDGMVAWRAQDQQCLLAMGCGAAKWFKRLLEGIMLIDEVDEEQGAVRVRNGLQALSGTGNVGGEKWTNGEGLLTPQVVQ